MLKTSLHINNGVIVKRNAIHSVNLDNEQRILKSSGNKSSFFNYVITVA